ncbi:putative integral membrane protein (TIGR02327 family) [Paenibacillus taihuensis]|uniref:Putative integral membrane protein (TIGR02327 family) n=1 Tax=Paenibacillus taihuensis TaxID=1156355 RepID=A0A3D9SHX2_9BACL|nr:DUF1146 domain-containing protein [Paenibacillus taihuensis]REE91468.1 putative integral membrane protein (TIGR02327 family) [Paenibacillus taihuensis]
MMDQLAATASMYAIINIFVEICSIALAWFAIQELKLDAILKRPRSAQARLLQIMLAIVLGHAFARFVLDYWGWSVSLKGIAGLG